MLASFAWTGLVLGFASLYLMQMIWERAVGAVWSWLGVIGALALASFGVYLGRFLRFNSWDALVHPRQDRARDRHARSTIPSAIRGSSARCSRSRPR